jgi:5-methylcytosine-specific restriction enzyme A
MMHIGEAVDNRPLCDLYGVGIMGGIQVNTRRNLIVLVSNNTDQTYRNEWRDGVLQHFVGTGSVGPQKLGRQNKTLANAGNSGSTIHLFEVFETSRYVYAGEVELAGEPYRSDQTDARKESRFVWIFPLRKKQASAEPAYTENR